MSIVRENLMASASYTPYCGAENCPHRWPRTFRRDGQFQCSCGWRSSFDAPFMAAYKAKWGLT